MSDELRAAAKAAVSGVYPVETATETMIGALRVCQAYLADYPETWQERLLVEKRQLHERCCELHGFLYTPTYRELDKGQQDLLVKQFDAMMEYKGCLNERIAALGIEAKAVTT